MENENSALFWFPAIEADGLPVPKTAMVPYYHHKTLSIFDGEDSEEFIRLVEAVTAAAGTIGYPVFIRSDLTSAKHSGPKSYLAESEDRITPVLAATIEDNEMKLWLERCGPKAIMVREFLHLSSKFTAFSGFPVSREWRFFADENHVLCSHPYWPPEAIDGHSSDPDWRGKLASINELPYSYSTLSELAIRAASACGGGSWSVDFAMDTNGGWWLIDMATMKTSWHWPGCPNGGKR